MKGFNEGNKEDHNDLLSVMTAIDDSGNFLSGTPTNQVRQRKAFVIRLKLLIKVTGLLSVRPELWVTAFRQLFRLAESGWWKRLPFLPIPSLELIEFRSKTQYGSLEVEIEAADVLAWLIWSKEFQQLKN